MSQAGGSSESGLEVSIHYRDGVPELTPAFTPSIDLPSLMPLAPSAAPDSPATLPPPLTVAGADQPGKLETYISNRPAVQRALQLRADPRFDKLPAAAKTELLQEWGVLLFSKAVPSRDLLIDECRPLDQEQREYADENRRVEQESYAIKVVDNDLTYRIGEYNKQVAAWNTEWTANQSAIARYNQEYIPYKQQIDAQNAEVRRYQQECSGPLPPGPFQRCTAWYATLSQRKAQLDRQTASMNQRAEQLNQQVTSLKSRGQSLEQRKAELTTALANLKARIEKYNAAVKHLQDWKTTFEQSWDFEKGRIAAWLAELEKFNQKLEAALAATAG